MNRFLQNKSRDVSIFEEALLLECIKPNSRRIKLPHC